MLPKLNRKKMQELVDYFNNEVYTDKRKDNWEDSNQLRELEEEKQREMEAYYNSQNKK